MSFNPTIVSTTVERSGGLTEPTTERTTETRYWLERDDNLCITTTGLMLERGRYGDPEREVLQINCCSEEWQDAIINCVAAQHTVANDSTASDYTRERARQFLERLRDKLPQPAAR